MTESVFADDLDTIRKVLTQLRALGYPHRGRRLRYRLLVARVPEAPSARHAQDRPRFIDGIVTDPGDAAIVASALEHLARARAVTVAEGIETPEQVAHSPRSAATPGRVSTSRRRSPRASLAAYVIARPREPRFTAGQPRGTGTRRSGGRRTVRRRRCRRRDARTSPRRWPRRGAGSRARSG